MAAQRGYADLLTLSHTALLGRFLLVFPHVFPQQTCCGASSSAQIRYTGLHSDARLQCLCDTPQHQRGIQRNIAGRQALAWRQRLSSRAHSYVKRLDTAARACAGLLKIHAATLSRATPPGQANAPVPNAQLKQREPGVTLNHSINIM